MPTLEEIANSRTARQRTEKTDPVKSNPNARVVSRDRLHFMPGQPRVYFSPEEGQKLRESLRVNGQLQPLLVRPWKNHEGIEIEGHFEVIAGERRARYSMPGSDWAGLNEFKVEVRALNDVEAFLASLAENLDRHDLTTYDEVIAVKRLAEEFGMSQTAIQKALNQERGWVQNRIKAATLPEALLEQLKKPDSLSKALEIGKAPNSKLMDRLTDNFDRYTVEGIKGEIEAWKARYAPQLLPKQKAKAETVPFNWAGQGSAAPSPREPEPHYRQSGYTDPDVPAVPQDSGIRTSRPLVEPFVPVQKHYNPPEVFPSALPVALERMERDLYNWRFQYEKIVKTGAYAYEARNEMRTRLENIMAHAQSALDEIERWADEGK